MQYLAIFGNGTGQGRIFYGTLIGSSIFSSIHVICNDCVIMKGHFSTQKALQSK